MEEYYFSTELGDNHTLCLAPLTDRRINLASQEITDPSGYFLYEKRGGGDLAGIEIIAQVFSEEAVLRLREAFGLD